MPGLPPLPPCDRQVVQKVRGKFYYFGKVANDPEGQAALALWIGQKDDLLAGKTPRTKPEGLVLRELLDRYVVAQRERVDGGEITARSFVEIYHTCRRIGDVLDLDRLVVDLGPDDFAKVRRNVAKVWGPIRLGNEVQRVRSLFKFGYDSGLIDRPIRFGPMFKKPSAKTLRLNRANGERAFTAEQLRAIIDAAGVQMKAMMLAGHQLRVWQRRLCQAANWRPGPASRMGGVPSAEDGNHRRYRLWPETIVALQEAIDERPKPKGQGRRLLGYS